MNVLDDTAATLAMDTKPEDRSGAVSSQISTGCATDPSIHDNGARISNSPLSRGSGVLRGAESSPIAPTHSALTRAGRLRRWRPA
eukprot:295272-Prymnesium_polylepis.1